MKLFGRLRSLVDPASVEQPPTDVFAALIDDLYAPLASFVIGATASTAVCGVTAWRTGNAWLTVLAVSMVVIAAVRVVITLDYRKHQRTIGGDAAALRAGNDGTKSAPRSTRHAWAALASSPSRSSTIRSAISCSMRPRSAIRPGLRRATPAGRGSR